MKAIDGGWDCLLWEFFEENLIRIYGDLKKTTDTTNSSAEERDMDSIPASVVCQFKAQNL